jgi:hypothetical protein
MYANLGIHWASAIPAFLALMCVPFPFLFYHYGPAIRSRCKFAASAAEELKKMKEEKDKDDAEGASGGLKAADKGKVSSARGDTEENKQVEKEVKDGKQ